MASKSVSRTPVAQPIFEAEAKERGIDFQRTRNWMVMSAGGRTFRVRRTIVDTTSMRARRYCADKQLSRALVRAAGGQAVQGEAFHRSEMETALRYARFLGWPVVVKPQRGGRGKGITTNIRTEDAFRAAWEDVPAKYETVIVEQHFDGNEYRALLVGTKVVAVVERVPAYVVGTNEQTIENLIAEKNVRRKAHPKAPPIKVDNNLLRVLAEQGLNLNSIPEHGRRVPLRTVSNVSTGGESIDRTDEFHPSLMAALQEIAELLPPIDIAGYDVIVRDMEIGAELGNWVVVEINTGPMLALHLYPFEGQPRNVVGALLDSLFPETSESARKLKLERQRRRQQRRKRKPLALHQRLWRGLKRCLMPKPAT